ncbi:MAG: hypothetical protein AAF590_03270 [Pseudomonadota bacterium]
MIKTLALIVFAFSSVSLAQAKVLLPSETGPPQCAEGEVFDQPSQRCVPADQRQE